MGDELDAETDINVPRLLFFSRKMLGYSATEAKLMTVREVCEQFEEYLKYTNAQQGSIAEDTEVV